MEILYDTTDAALVNTPLFNGNITGIKWKTPIDGSQNPDQRRNYTFQYDRLNRLTQANYARYSTSTSAWNKDIGTFNESLTYDDNGNIYTLTRTKPKRGTSFGVISGTMDNLGYTYASGNQSNKLIKIDDTSGDLAGFNNGSSQATEYTYSEAGSMETDLNKGITHVYYDSITNKPNEVVITGGYIKYVYDAAGNKLSKKVFKSLGSTSYLQSQTDYVGEFMYENSALNLISVPDGRVIHSNGTNLFPSPDGSSTPWFPANGSVTISTVTMGPENYIKVVSNQASGAPGVWPIGGVYTVQPGEKYLFRVKGYSAQANTGQLWLANGALTFFVLGPSLPINNDGFVSIEVTIPAGVTDLRVGVEWTVGVAVGDIFYLNNVELLKITDEYQFALADHLGNTRVVYGNPFETVNLITGADTECNSVTGFTASGSTVTAVLQNGEYYVKCVASASGGTPGITPIGATYTVVPGEKYTFKVKGYADLANAYLYIWGSAGDLVWKGSAMQAGASKERWISNDITIPDNVTQIRVGVLFSGQAAGNAFYLNQVGLYKFQDDDYSAGFETANQAAEATKYLNYNTAKIVANVAVNAHTGNAAYRLTASTTPSSGEVIGPAQSLRVHTGDVVDMRVYGKYIGATTTSTTIGGMIAGALQTAFGISAGGGTDAPFQSISGLFSGGAIIGTTGYAYEDNNAPKAFLNFILFDDNYVPYDFGYDQIGQLGAEPSAGDLMHLKARVTRPGYIYIYLSNENQVVQEVYGACPALVAGMISRSNWSRPQPCRTRSTTHSACRLRRAG
jgi:YD repeat-containing protein